MSDCELRCVHRYDLTRSWLVGSGCLTSTTRWPVPGKPCSLSVTPSCNLLVTCQEPNKLVELSADSGQCVREVALQEDIVNPRHGVQLTTGQYVVCCGSRLFHLHRVCTVDDNGKVTRSYGSQGGSDFGQLKGPSHLAVDEDLQLIFVVDWGNDKVVVLNQALELVGHITVGLPYSLRLYLHHAKRRLYVGQWPNDVGLIVIQL